MENYDRLPAVMVFAHGPECSWHLHNMTSLMVALNASAYPFAALGGTWEDWAPQIRFGGDQAKGLHRMFCVAGLGPALPGALDARFSCCATFLVHRDRVLARPKAVWELLFHLAYEVRIGLSGCGAGYCAVLSSSYWHTGRRTTGWTRGREGGGVGHEQWGCPSQSE